MLLLLAATAFAYDVRPGDTLSSISRSEIGHPLALNPGIQEPGSEPSRCGIADRRDLARHPV